MFRPNLKCKISVIVGSDLYGKRLYSSYMTVPFSIVKLERRSDKTSVRTDSSASRGSAQEILADARFLFPKNVSLHEGDMVEFGDFKLTVVSVWPRYRVTGELDHWQVDCNIWGD